jgi:hypothetical protein
MVLLDWTEDRPLTFGGAALGGLRGVVLVGGVCSAAL